MTNAFNPTSNVEPLFIENHYLSVKNDQLWSRNKNKSFLSQSLLGKWIRWIFNPEEHISKVRDQFERLIQAHKGDAPIAETANLLVHAHKFNKLINTHNQSWIYTVLKCKTVAPLALNALEEKCSAHLTSLTTAINQHKPPFSPGAIQCFDASQKGLEPVAVLKHIPAFQTELANIEGLLNQIKGASTGDQKKHLDDYSLLMKELKESYKEPSEHLDQVNALLASVWISDEQKNNLELLFLSHRIKLCKADDLTAIERDCIDFERENPPFADQIKTLNTQIAKLKHLQTQAAKLEPFKMCTSMTQEINVLWREFQKARNEAGISPLAYQVNEKAANIVSTIENRPRQCEEWIKFFKDKGCSSTDFRYKGTFEKDIDGNRVEIYPYSSRDIFYHPWDPFYTSRNLISASEGEGLAKFLQELPEGTEKTKVLAAQKEFDKQLLKVRKVDEAVAKAKAIYDNQSKKDVKTSEQVLGQLNDIVSAFGAQDHHDYLSKLVAFYTRQLQNKIAREKATAQNKT